MHKNVSINNKYLRTYSKAFVSISIALALAACGGGGNTGGEGSTGGGGGITGGDGSTGGSGGSTGGSTSTIYISEASSSNSSFDDEEGDSPDWFEIFNSGSSRINIEGWTVTDDIDEPDKWTFPTTVLAPKDYLKIWASKKDRTTSGIHRTLVNEGDSWSYLVPSSPVETSWVNTNYDDSAWLQGISGFGYGDDDDSTQIEVGTGSVFARTSFNISSTGNIDAVWFDIDYDDAFVAYLNGIEIARSNMLGARPSFDARPTSDREAVMYQSGRPQRFDLNDYASILTDGENVLSVQVHNISASSSDLTLIPFLTARYNTETNDGVTPPDILSFEDFGLHTNFKLASSGETLYLFDNSGDIQSFLVVEGLVTDKSIGISIIDDSVVYYDRPTPGSQNVLNEYRGITLSEVIFSNPGGEFNGSSVTLSGATEEEIIRYTLDSTVPTSSSPQYSDAINIADNTVIRARVFQQNYIPSHTESRTYLPSASHDLPIVSLITDPDNMFDNDSGIYVYGDEYEDALPFFGANFWQDWEKDIHFSFYEANGTLGVEMDAGIKIFGAWSRANEQRSFSIFARGRYGDKKIDYPLFPEQSYSKFESIVIRNSGNDWMRSMIRDATMTSLMAGADVEFQDFRSVAAYLNGEYWGLYNIREKVNEHFIASKHDIDEEDIDILEHNSAIVHGSNEEYENLISFISDNDLADQSNYNYVASQVDISNFIRYQVAQIYFDNRDWPGNNIKFWKSPETKWRWILYDTDFGFGIWDPADHIQNTLAFALSDNGPGWPNPPWSTLLLRRLIENDDFKHQFVNQFSDYFNTRFSASNVSQHIENIAVSIESEIPRQTSRWQEFTDVRDWRSEIANMKEFANNRVESLSDHIENQFSLTGKSSLDVTVSQASRGSVDLNSLNINSTSWTGNYFNGIPLALTAVPSEGFIFSQWSGASTSTNPSISITLTGNSGIEAIFIAAP